MSERIGFTEKRIRDLEPVPGKQVEYFDKTDRLLGIRISAGGTKSFFVKKRVHGILIRVGLGTWPDISLLKARAAYQEAMEQMRKGINPNLEKKRHTIENSDKRGILSAVFESYLDAGGKNGKLKQVTKTGYQYCFQALSSWHNKRVEEITAGMVQTRYQELTKESGPYSANRAMGLLKYLMAHSMEHLGRPAVNPVTGVKWNTEKPRRKNVPPESLPALFAAIDNIKGNSGADLYKLLLFTGLRKSEATQLKWSDIDLDKKTLHITDTKNGEPLHIPLSGFAASILEIRRTKTQGSLWVFPSYGRTGHITNTSILDKYITEQGVKVYPHLLRKRFTTTAKLLCPAFVVDILTAHVPSGSVTDRNYTIPSTEELRPFTEKVTAELLRLVGMDQVG